MEALKITSNENYSDTYLQQYWPELPNSPVGWADNAVLMLGYQDAALAVKKHLGGRTGRMLDVSTGPALAPLLAMITAVSEVQLSDFEEDNRTALQTMPVSYWRNYVPMLTKLFDRPETKISEILATLDQLRTTHHPLKVDLFNDLPFFNAVDPRSFDIISMQFVADGITDNEPDYLRCLGRVTDMVKPGGAFIMSAVVDSVDWQMGSFSQPSPNVSEKTILNFLASQKLRVINLSRSMRHPGLTYSGGWIVLAAVRDL